MSHQLQQQFCESVRQSGPEWFINKKVLDVGSLDINGNNREYFKDCEYTGVDIAPGNNVDIVSKCHELEFEDGYFDTILCTEMLEHDIYWKESLCKMVAMLKNNGLLIITCATTGRAEHGTFKESPEDSPFTSQIEGWKNYYRNLSIVDFLEVFTHDLFTIYSFKIDNVIKDLYFWGIKPEFDT